MRKNHLLFVLAAFFSLLSVTSCKYKLKDGINWDSNIVSPLLKSSLTLGDALTDTNIVQTNGDNSITLVLRDTLIDLLLSDLIVVPDTGLRMTVTLDSIKLSQENINERIWLMDLARAAGIDAFISLFQGGTTFFPIPAQTALTSDPQDIDASQYFQTATLVGGFLDVQIINKLPTNLTDVIFQLRNRGDFGNTDVLIQDTILSIPKNATVNRSFPMAGKTIESGMVGQLINLNTTEIPTGTPIDTNVQYLDLNISIRNLTAATATAVFPEQNVINVTNNGTFNFGNGIKITKLSAKAGEINIQAFNTINDTLYFTYRLISAENIYGDIPFVSSILPPGTIANPSVIDESFPLGGYSIDMTLKGDSVNKFAQQLVGTLKYSGNLNTMTLQDTISVLYQLRYIDPSYVEGYLGLITETFQEGLSFDFFDPILGGLLNLPEAKMTMVLENSVGMDGELVINGIQAINTRTNQSLNLGGPALSGRITIPGPRLPNVGQTISSTIELNNQNSNIDQFFGMMPDSLYIDMEVVANGNANPALLDNFATDQSRISAFMDLEVPLYGLADAIVIQDSLDLDMTSINLNKDIKSGSLKLFVENYFPFEVETQIFFFNDNGIMIDSLIHSGDKGIIPAGIIGANGVVNAPTKGEVSSFFDEYRMTKLRTGAKTAIIRFKISTKPANTSIRVYADYRVDFTLVADFTLNIHN